MDSRLPSSASEQPVHRIFIHQPTRSASDTLQESCNTTAAPHAD
jgi:hypothetical protein